MHTYHPNASAHALLSPSCEECRREPLGELDNEHMMALTGHSRRDLEALLPKALLVPVLSLNAMSVQSELPGPNPIDLLHVPGADLQHLPRAALMILCENCQKEAYAERAVIAGPTDALHYFERIRDATTETVLALYMDTRNRVLKRQARTIGIGGLRATVIQPRDVVAPALAIPCAGIILAHNHPSGDTRPSAEDLEVTRQMAAACRLFGIELLDHLILSQQGYTSLKEIGAI